MIFPLVFELNPFRDGVWQHTIPFFSIIVGMYLVVAANFYVSDANMGTGQSLYFVMYTIISFTFILCVCVDFLGYAANCPVNGTDSNGNWILDCGSWRGPFLPWYMTGVLDYMWMFCLALISRFIPHGELLHLNFEVIVKSKVSAGANVLGTSEAMVELTPQPQAVGDGML